MNERKERICELCGNEIQANKYVSNARFCHSCKNIYRRAEQRLRHQRHTEISKLDKQECIKLARSILEEQISNNEIMSQENAKPCKFCGAMTTSVTGFCSNCRKEHYDEVYKITGRSNGWDGGKGLNPSKRIASRFNANREYYRTFGIDVR